MDGASFCLGILVGCGIMHVALLYIAWELRKEWQQARATGHRYRPAIRGRELLLVDVEDFQVAE